jgi:hypothetical protein
MKHPAELAGKLAKQWRNGAHREGRLLEPDTWPIVLMIGRPTPNEFSKTTELREHLQRWRSVITGDVRWQPVQYRAASEPVSIPVEWILHSPSEWIEATDDQRVQQEYQQLNQVVQGLTPIFHKIVIRQRALVIGKPVAEIIQAGALALELSPSCAQGKPLRALSVAGIDSKFFERHRQLITLFLDERFEGEASKQGLETFLNAAVDNDHWLLLVPLASGLLPFDRLRVRSRELLKTELPANFILIIENERCLHQLPEAADTIAILGSGANLRWMSAQWLRKKKIAYWGDVDSWGLQLLARARRLQPGLHPLLMAQEIYDKFSDHAVVEPTTASPEAPKGLTRSEAVLYHDLLARERGRLEQEFIAGDLVVDAIGEWLKSCK